MIIIKSILYTLFNVVGAFLPKQYASILLYHDIDDSDLYLTVSLEQFKKQMKYLHDNKYKVVSLKTLSDTLKQNGVIQKKTAVLTFDDGYKSHLSSVLPILEEYNFHGTFFISTNFIGKEIDNSEHKPQAVMNEDELKKLDASKHADIEPHTCSHMELPKLGKDEKVREIEVSKKNIETMLNKKSSTFAYPRGAYDEESIDVVEKLGFTSAVTVEEGIVQSSSNILILPRNTINSSTRMPEFKIKLQYISGFVFLLRKSLHI